MAQSDTSPCDYPFSITPSDSVPISHAIRGFSVAVGGTVKITRLDGTQDTLTLPAGVCPARVLLIWATGTAATGFTGFADR